MQNFNKNDYVVGNTVYLLFIGGYGTEKKDPEQVIFEAVIKAVGRKYITVRKGVIEIRFEYDKETESIWQKYDYGRDYEIYTTRGKAVEALNKKKLEKDICNLSARLTCSHFDDNSIGQLELLKAIMVGTMTNYEKEKLPDILMRLLPSMEKDTFYRKIWAEDVMRDIKSFAADKGIRLSDENIKEAAEAYVNGRYDCNFSYWENIESIISEIPKEEPEFYTLHNCLTKHLQTEVFEIKRCSAIDIDFLTNDGKEDEVQLNVTENILTRAGKEELEELFDSLTKEFNTKSNRILSCTVVASADTEEELEKMGY